MAHSRKRWSKYVPIEEQKLLEEGWDIVARARHLTDLPALPKGSKRKVIKVKLKGMEGEFYSLFTKRPYYIKEPFGLPFELTERDKFRRLMG